MSTMIKQAQRDLRVQLAKLDDDQVIGVDELAALLDTSAGMIYRLGYASPDKLPPRLTCFGRRAAWRLGTCREWVRSLPTEAGQPMQNTLEPTRPRMGRPRARDQSRGA